jgi:hypothetical protein
MLSCRKRSASVAAYVRHHAVERVRHDFHHDDVVLFDLSVRSRPQPPLRVIGHTP